MPAASSNRNIRSPYGILAVVALSAVLGFLSLRGSPAWRDGIVGDGDAWQNVWNIEHVRHWISGGGDLFSSRMVWAPEGTGLGTHTLALAFSLPAAVISYPLGKPLAYNLTVLGTFVLCALGGYRLARTLDLSRGASVLVGLVVAFSPPRFARSFGHLNLLGLGWVLLAISGMVETLKAPTVAGRRRGFAFLALGTAATLYTDYYMAVLAFLSVAVFILLARWIAVDQTWSRAAWLTAAVLLGVILSGPQLWATFRDSRGTAGGHDSKWCSCAVTSLVIPGRLQSVSTLTTAWTEKNHQNKVEGAAYLGLSLILGSAVMWRRVRGATLAVAVSGGIALVLSLGPQLRVFDTLLNLPLPYAVVRFFLPVLDKGGCVTRFVQLAVVPLAVLFAAWVEQLWSRSRVSGVVVCSVLALEFWPVRPAVEGWQLQPDPALRVIVDSPRAVVADVDGGVWPLIRQLQHGRPLLTGYVSRLPVALAEERNKAAAWAYLTGKGEPPGDVAAATSELQDRWGVRWLVGPNSPEFLARVGKLDLAPVGSSDRSLVFDVGERPRTQVPTETPKVPAP